MFIFQFDVVLALLLAFAVFIFIPRSLRWIYLLALSIVLLAFASLSGLLLMALQTLFAYCIVFALGRIKTPIWRLWLCWASVFIELCPILIFRLWSGPIATRDWLLPLGLSFYTFQLIAYILEVYWERRPIEKNLGRFMLFSFLFANKNVGPIERPTLLDQIKDLPFPSSEVLFRSAFFIWLGLFQKFAIADNIAPYVDPVLAKPQDFAGIPVWCAILLSKYQIFCDFSGGSLVALGLAGVFGLKLTKNFDRPFAALSLREFWRRWHISLQSWIRDYVFFPLLTTRFARFGVFPILLLTFILFGIWHDFRWTFVAYGALQAVLLWLALDRWIMRFFSRATAPFILVFNYCVLLCLPSVLFRATSLQQAWDIWRHLGLRLGSWDFFIGMGKTSLPKIGFFILLNELWQWADAKWKLLDLIARRTWVERVGLSLVLLIFLFLTAKLDQNLDFVYRQY